MKELMFGRNRIVAFKNEKGEVVMLHYKRHPLYDISIALDKLLGRRIFRGILSLFGIDTIKACTVDVI